jgi:hypothetical protein
MILKERRPDCQKEGSLKRVVQSKKSGGCTSDPNPNLLTPIQSCSWGMFSHYSNEQTKGTEANVRRLHPTAVIRQRPAGAISLVR